MYCKYVNNQQREGLAVNNSIYVVMEIIPEQSKSVKIRYNKDNIQMLCITNVSYSTVT